MKIVTMNEPRVYLSEEELRQLLRMPPTVTLSLAHAEVQKNSRGGIGLCLVFRQEIGHKDVSISSILDTEFPATI